MTMSPDEIARRFRQTDNDVQSIYELLTGLAEKVDGVDTRLAARIDDLATHFDGVDGGLAGIGGRLEGIDTTLAEVLRRLPEPLGH